MPTHCLINSNLIRPLTGSSLDLDSKEGGGTWQKYGEKNKACVSDSWGKITGGYKIPDTHCPEGHDKMWASVGNMEGAREKCEHVERATRNEQTKALLKNSLWKALSMSLPVCGQSEGVMMGLCRAGRGQPADTEERLQQQYDVIKEGQCDSSTSNEGGG